MNVLITCVGAYRDPRLPALPGVYGDASLWASLVETIPGARAVVLRDCSAAEWQAAVAAGPDLCVFSGHGVVKTVHRERWEGLVFVREGRIEVLWDAQLLGALPERTLLFSDSCFGGGLADQSDLASGLASLQSRAPLPTVELGAQRGQFSVARAAAASDAALTRAQVPAHLRLAATTLPHQQAFEVRIDGTPVGLGTYATMEALRRLTAPGAAAPTPGELRATVAARMRALSARAYSTPSGQGWDELAAMFWSAANG